MSRERVDCMKFPSMKKEAAFTKVNGGTENFGDDLLFLHPDFECNLCFTSIKSSH